MKKDNKPKGSNILYLIYYILFFLHLFTFQTPTFIIRE